MKTPPATMAGFFVELQNKLKLSDIHYAGIVFSGRIDCLGKTQRAAW